MDLVTKCRTTVNNYINEKELTDEILEEITKVPEDVFKSMIRIVELNQTHEVIEYFKDYETYLKMSLIEKMVFHMATIVCAVHTSPFPFPYTTMFETKVRAIKAKFENS